MTGSIQGTGSASATPKGAGRLAATCLVAAALLTGRFNTCAAQVSGHATTASTLAAKGTLARTFATTGSAAASLKGRGRLAGTLAGAATVTHSTPSVPFAMNSIVQDLATGNGAGVTLSMPTNVAAVLFEVGGLGSATVNWEGIGSSTSVHPVVGISYTTLTPAVTATTNDFYAVNCVGMKTIQARISNYVSGTITVTAHEILPAPQFASLQGAYPLSATIGNFPADQLVHATNLDLATSALRDAITASGVSAKTLADVVTALTAPTPMRGALTDHSGTIASGGTAQSVMIANTSRKFLYIQNLSNAELWVDFGATAVQTQPSLKLLANETLGGWNFVPTGAVSIIGATTGQAFAAREA